jgi:hypothetical protein
MLLHSVCLPEDVAMAPCGCMLKMLNLLFWEASRTAASGAGGGEQLSPPPRWGVHAVHVPFRGAEGGGGSPPALLLFSM